MKISDDVKRALEFTAEITDSCYSDDGYCLNGSEIDNLEETAQAVIQAYLKTVVWKPFDVNVKPWPDFDTPEGMQWYTMDEDGFCSMETFDVQYWVDSRIVLYCDPTDIIPDVRGDE